MDDFDLGTGVNWDSYLFDDPSGDYTTYTNDVDSGVNWDSYDFDSPIGDFDFSGDPYEMPYASDGTAPDVPLEGSGALSGIAKFLSGLANGSGGGISGDLGSILANLGKLYTVNNDIAQNQETNSILQDLLRNQRDLNSATMKTNANNDYRSFTGQAGGFTGDAYNVAMNNAKMNLMMSLMGNDDKINAADKNALSQAFGNIQYAYEPVYQGYANDSINRRNYEYAAPYNSLAPFTPPGQAQTYGANNSAINTVPAGADPASVDAYRNYVLGNLG